MMAIVYIANISVLNNDLTHYHPYVSPLRVQKTEKIKNSQNKKLSVLGELLLAKHLGKTPSYTVNEKGKPTGETVEFSISHSGEYAVCAVSQQPIGVDIEKIRSVNIDVAKRFTEEEYKKIRNSKNPQDALFSLWVKKESFLKYKGTGIAGGLDFDTKTAGNFTESEIIDGYKIAVCSCEKTEFIIVNKI